MQLSLGYYDSEEVTLWRPKPYQDTIIGRINMKRLLPALTLALCLAA